MTAFARLAATGCPPPAALALALAAELRPVDLAPARAALDALAGDMAPARGRTAYEQLAHCGRVTAARLTARVRPAEVDDLLLDRVLALGAGDPVCWAIACVQAARHVGIPLGIVADADQHVLVAHRGLQATVVLEPQAPRTPIDATRLPAGDLTWRCAHQATLLLAGRLVARATRCGRHDDALRAASLRLELPLDAATLVALAHERDLIASRMN